MQIEESIRNKVNHLLNTMPQNLGHALGIEFTRLGKDNVAATMPVDENTIQPFGILHGGASVALAETLVSIGAWLNLENEGKMAVGVEINANHIRPVKKGNKVIGTAVPIRLGKKIQVWQAKIHTDENKLVCVSRCTIAVIDRL